MIDPEVAWDKLSSFETSEDLVDYLVSEGAFGIRGRAISCPIAVWMINQTGKRVSVADCIRIGITASNILGPSDAEFKHTDVTTTFIEKFDNGDYPQLDVYKVQTFTLE